MLGPRFGETVPRVSSFPTFILPLPPSSSRLVVIVTVTVIVGTVTVFNYVQDVPRETRQLRMSCFSVAVLFSYSSSDFERSWLATSTSGLRINGWPSGQPRRFRWHGKIGARLRYHGGGGRF